MAIATAKLPAKKSPKPPPAASADSGSSAPVHGVDDYKGSLVLDDQGSSLTGWNQTASYCPGTPGMLANGIVRTDSSGEATLTTPSKPGSCVALISPGAYGLGT